MTVGIICEYNPLHLGHKKQIDRIREVFGPETVIVCAMSGNFVQRGMPAIIDRQTRAKAAIFSGADLVLELPVTTALSSAEGFAAGGVKITPVGFLVIREGTVRMLPIATPANTTADRLVEQVPDVLDKITAFIDTRIEKKGE